MQLWLYQQECLTAITKAYRVNGINCLLVSLLPETDKTMIFSYLFRALQLRRKTMLLAHREELLEHVRDKMMGINPYAVVEIEQAERKASPDADIVIASVPSIGRNGSRRLTRFGPYDFGLIAVDKACHSVAPIYRNILFLFRSTQ